METLGTMALNLLTQKAMSNGNEPTGTYAPQHSAKTIAQLIKGA